MIIVKKWLKRENIYIFLVHNIIYIYPNIDI